MVDIRPWLQEQYAPAVLVASTPAAEALIQSKNGLGLVDLLRPYASAFGLNVPVRVGESSVRVQDLRVRFFDVGTLYQPPPEVIEDHLQEVLKVSSQRNAKLDPSPDLLQRFMLDSPPDMRELTPWFEAYRSEFMRLLRFGDHETLDHPVACVYAIPADVQNPSSHFDTLVAQLALPPLMQQDVMYTLRDKDFPRHYLLLLDSSTGMNEKRAMDNLVAIRQLYGEAHCSILRINSGNGDRAHSGAPVDFFARYQFTCLTSGGAGEPRLRPPPPPGGVGAYLTVQDLDSIGGFVREFMCRTLLPKLEDRIARLNASITAARRGLRNRLNRFWKGAAEDRQTDRPYPWHSVEGQMRQLGDLAFLMRQYAFAESTYRLAAQDYQAEGNSKWYAGVEEMIGLCSVLGEPADPIAAVLLQNDPMKYFMRAYEHYTKPPAALLAAAAPPASGGGAPGGGAPAPLPPAALAASKVGRMLATRVVMLGAAVQSAAGRYRAASDALMRAQSEEENARAGLLLEQSAYCMLYLRPPLVRKFAFQMVLAGIRYICCGQKRIAIHAYRQVLALYLGRRWRYIEEHLHAVLGAQCVEYGDKDRALWHYCALLDCGHRPAAQQQNNVGQFLNLLAGVRDQLAITHDGVSLVDSLPLPLVNRHDVRVLCSDTACYSGPAARALPESSWLKMEACCTSGSNNWLVEGGGAKQERDHEEYTMCVSGEEVGVQVEFRNPLAVKLKVSNVRLICTFTHESDPIAAGKGPVALPDSSMPSSFAATTSSSSSSAQSSNPLADGSHPLLPGAAPPAISTQPGSEYLHVAEAQFTLHPGEALVEVLKVLPRAPGWLRITGVTWTLNGTAHGRITFDVKGRRRKKPKGERPGQLKHYPPHRRLLFQVVPAMPRLELLGDPLPPALYSGELCRVIMRVRNSGGLPLRSLALVVGHPEAVVPATDANKDRPLLDSLTDHREVVQLSKVPASARGSLQLYRLWPGRELAPGEVLEWPLWLHPRGQGTLKLPIVWYGEPVAPKGGMRHRTLRICGSVSVQPLLSARPVVWPSPTHLSQYLLRLGVDNSKDAERVVLQQLAAVTVPSLPSHHMAGAAGGDTPATPTNTPRPVPVGWRISMLGDTVGAPSSSTAAPGGLPGNATPDGAPSTTGGGSSVAARSLPLAVPLQPGESAGLFLQLLAPPPAAQQLRQVAGSSASVATTGATGAGTGARISQPPSGLATPGRADDPSAVAARAVAQAAEAVRSLALAEGGAGVGGVGPSGRASPYVDGSDSGLQQLNLFGPGVLAHFYRRGRRGMVAAPPTVGAAATPGGLPVQRTGGALTPGVGTPQQPLLSGGPQPVLAHSASFSPQTQALGPSGAPLRGTSFGPASTVGAAALPGPGGPGAAGSLGPMGPGRPPLPPGVAGPGAAGPGGGAPASAGQGQLVAAAGPGRPGPPLMLADPPLDLLLLWHVASSQRTGPHQGRQRLGLCRPYDPQSNRDLSGCIQAHTTPVRMLLTGPNGASSAASSTGSAGPLVRHDFRRSPLAVLPLRLLVRNNTALEAKLQIEVGEGWSSNDAPHSWQASTGLLGTSHTAAPAGAPGSLGPPGAGTMGPSPVGAGPTGGSGPLGQSMMAGPPGGGAGGGGGMMGSSMMGITYQAGLPPCPEYSWVGPSFVSVPQVEPGGEAEVTLAVAVFRPGAYAISGYRCTAFLEATGAVEVQRGEPLCFRVEGA
ncbi:hypothetical protein HYH02_005870 [Chlamydomonas schloesseri]|uniref:Trafficking protein particle complex subunit 8 n=1 Tax=Chlamydomonas schloesseri TaxID=2026947 RepID=A0A836B6K9_9CHLO|nr:hypothetical protein HYH02_005870 [Chlamydomonas schloesseri]|eukprot:KAG2449122.1 hypothetical protein HYH02_005870 [Chlamydomonas schloesseri]